MWWYVPVIPALRRLRQEDCEFGLHFNTLFHTNKNEGRKGGQGKERKPLG
jgi:hypothetical protein